jgi:DNA-binding response OmpR family regulator
MAKILLVEDDESTAEFVSSWLVDENHIVEHSANGAEGLDYSLLSDYDLILLDWDLPGMSGYEVLKALRAKGKKTPVIMLTGKSAINDKEAGLDGGADDYLTKPFDLRELSARVRAQLRRFGSQVTNVLSCRSLVLDPEKYRATNGGADIDLLPKEFALLEFFMRNPDKVFSADAVMRRVWNSDSESTTSAFRTALMRLRKKLEAPPGEKELIETVHGVGYRFNSQG